MLKKVTLNDTRTGMYVHKIVGSWFDSPFWQNSFLIESDDFLAKMRSAGVMELWIDTDRGLDLQKSGDAAETANAPFPGGTDSLPEPARPRFTFAPVEAASMRQERTRAAKVISSAKGAVTRMFNEARMGRLTDLTPAMTLVDEVAASVMRNQGALISLVRLKHADDYTYLHSVAVCAMMIALGRKIGLEDDAVRDCGLAGLLHDLGKMAVPPEILNKPGKLTDSEFLQVRRHPEAGFDMLAAWTDVPDMARDVCLHHHERFDGKGYPHGLRGDQISIHARMGAVCDVYDAITSNRPYKSGWCPAESLRRMADWTKEGHFDPALFAAFVTCMGIYPVGTLLRLKSGRMGVVVDNSKSLLKPIVKVFFSARSMSHIRPEEIDLAIHGSNEEIVAHEDAGKWGFGDITPYWAIA